MAPSEAFSLTFKPLVHPFWIRLGTTDGGEVLHSLIRNAYGGFIPEGESGPLCQDHFAGAISYGSAGLI